MWVGGSLQLPLYTISGQLKFLESKCSQMMAKIVNDGENVGSKFTCRC